MKYKYSIKDEIIGTVAIIILGGIFATGVYGTYRLITHFGKKDSVVAPTIPQVTTLVDPTQVFLEHLIQNQLQLADPFDLPDAPPPSDCGPTSVKIGPFKYRIKWRTMDEMPLQMGYSSYLRGEILLNTSLGHEARRDVLLHEILHMSFATHARNNEDGGKFEEDFFIESMTPNLFGVLRDNPELMKWIQQEGN